MKNFRCYLVNLLGKVFLKFTKKVKIKLLINHFLINTQFFFATKQRDIVVYFKSEKQVYYQIFKINNLW